MTSENILTITKEYLAYSEQEAYALVEERRHEANVVSSRISYKKETKKRREHWIVVIKEEMSKVEDFVSIDGEE